MRSRLLAILLVPPFLLAPAPPAAAFLGSSSVSEISHVAMTQNALASRAFVDDGFRWSFPRLRLLSAAILLLAASHTALHAMPPETPEAAMMRLASDTLPGIRLEPERVNLLTRAKQDADGLADQADAARESAVQFEEAVWHAFLFPDEDRGSLEEVQRDCTFALNQAMTRFRKLAADTSRRLAESGSPETDRAIQKYLDASGILQRLFAGYRIRAEAQEALLDVPAKATSVLVTRPATPTTRKRLSRLLKGNIREKWILFGEFPALYESANLPGRVGEAAQKFMKILLRIRVRDTMYRVHLGLYVWGREGPDQPSLSQVKDLAKALLAANAALFEAENELNLVTFALMHATVYREDVERDYWIVYILREEAKDLWREAKKQYGHPGIDPGTFESTRNDRVKTPPFLPTLVKIHRGRSSRFHFFQLRTSS